MADIRFIKDVVNSIFAHRASPPLILDKLVEILDTSVDIEISDLRIELVTTISEEEATSTSEPYPASIIETNKASTLPPHLITTKYVEKVTAQLIIQRLN